MAKKKLLKESQVRRFMGLAGLGALSENMASVYEDEDAAADDEAVDDVEDEDADIDDVGAEMSDEAPVEEPMEEPEGTVELEQEDVDVLADLAAKLPGIVDKLQGEEAMGDMPPAPEEDAMDMEDPMGDEDEEAEGAEGVIEEALRGVNLQLSSKEVVNEVARRVAKRILKAKQAQSKLDEALGNKSRTRRPYRRSRKK